MIEKLKKKFFISKSYSRNKIYFEFYGGKFIEDFFYVFTDNGLCNFIVILGSGFNGFTGYIIKCNYVG